MKFDSFTEYLCVFVMQFEHINEKKYKMLNRMFENLLNLYETEFIQVRLQRSTSSFQMTYKFLSAKSPSHSSSWRFNA